MPRPSLSLAVVGADYPNKRGPSRRFELNLCKPGEAVDLRTEPKNPADESAVAVYSARGIQLGYLTAERAPWIGGMIRQGRVIAAIFQAQTHWGAWLRIAFDGEMPVLPAQTVLSIDDSDDVDSGFWPDVIPPDD